jgi:hypothetical protein
LRQAQPGAIGIASVINAAVLADEPASATVMILDRADAGRGQGDHGEHIGDGIAAIGVPTGWLGNARKQKKDRIISALY